MKGSTFRRCGCRNPQTKRKYPEGKCPRLNSNKRADRDHGSWWGRFDAPPGADQKRRQIRVGPYDTETEAESALATEIARLGVGGQVTDRKLKVNAYLTNWLAGKRSLKATTYSSYEEAVRLYFIPALGHLRLCDLRDHHIGDLVTALGQINRPAPDGEKSSELLKRLTCIGRASQEGFRSVPDSAPCSLMAEGYLRAGRLGQGARSAGSRIMPAAGTGSPGLVRNVGCDGSGWRPPRGQGVNGRGSRGAGAGSASLTLVRGALARAPAT